MNSPLVRSLVVITALTACAGCKRSKDDPVISVNDDDADMNAAIAEAKQRWPEFVAAFDEKKGTDFAAKYPFPMKGGGNEHIWLGVTTITGDQVTGTIDNEPNGDVGHKLGESVTVPSKDISDWLYTPPGSKEPAGGFTIRVLLARQKRR